MNRIDYCIVFVSDMTRSIEFYRDVLGLPLRFESPNWSELATEGATLALHPAGPSAGPTPERTAAATCNPGFPVDDLDQFHAAMTSKNVTCIQPPTDEDFGVKLAIYADPDGLPFSVAERPAR